MDLQGVARQKRRMRDEQAREETSRSEEHEVTVERVRAHAEKYCTSD